MTDVEIGLQVARKVFERRGNQSEAHLSEAELSAYCTLAARLAIEKHATVYVEPDEARTPRK